MRKVLLVSMAIWGALMLSCSPEKMPDVSPIAQNQGGGQNQQNNNNEQNNQQDNQQGQETTPSISVSPSSLSFESGSSSKTVTVTSNVEWDFSCSDTWLSATKNGSSLSVSVTANQSAARTSSIYLRQQGQTSNLATINVSQEGASSSSASDNTYTVNGVSFKMILVEGGTFTMGATAEQGDDVGVDEKPVHSVTLSTFYIGETEVTQELWDTVMGSNPSFYKGKQLPVDYVSWNAGQEFILKLNSLTGKNFRLPTEAEWEYAARGGKKSQGYKYAGSNMIDIVAWYTVNSYDMGYNSPFYGPQAVGGKAPNELGLYNMSGNVYEWCYDWYKSSSYSSEAQTNPVGVSFGSSRVCRGGSWNDNAWYCRVSCRGFGAPDTTYSGCGLRLAL